MPRSTHVLALALLPAGCIDLDWRLLHGGSDDISASDTDATTATATATATTIGATATISATGNGDVSTGADGSTTDAPPPGVTPENLRVAFFGDHGLGPDSVATLQLVRDEQADFLVILGDYDYKNDPTAWHDQLDEGLGPEFPMFAVAGNHDEAEWDGYRDVLMDRLGPIVDAECDGEIGIQMSCRYQGIQLVLSGVGTMDPPGRVSHEDFISQTLAESDSIWRVCAWHKNQHDMQLGAKTDEVGWEAYQNCQAGGAIIATGHEHTYERTMTLTDVGNRDAGHGAIGEPEVMEVGPGSTFVFVAGLGGVGIRDRDADHQDDTWWATQYTSDVYIQNLDPIEDFTAEIGVLFIDFHVDGDPYKARGYFKNLAGEMIDEFEIRKTD